MSAPERIWVWETWRKGAQASGEWCNYTANGTEYVRADLCPAQAPAPSDWDDAIEAAAQVCDRRAKACRTTVGVDAEGQLEGAAEDIRGLKKEGG